MSARQRVRRCTRAYVPLRVRGMCKGALGGDRMCASCERACVCACTCVREGARPGMRGRVCLRVRVCVCGACVACAGMCMCVCVLGHLALHACTSDTYAALLMARALVAPSRPKRPQQALGFPLQSCCHWCPRGSVNTMGSPCPLQPGGIPH
eukprot:4447532-Lingulodinium_polyedra.AAC.2